MLWPSVFDDAMYFGLIVSVGLLSLGIGANAAPADVERAAERWVCRVTPGIEWAWIVEAGADAAVLLLTRDGKLRVLDPATGEDRLAEPLQLARGARVSPQQSRVSRAGLVALFDRHAIDALRFRPTPQLLWRRGRPTSETAEFPDDPEYLAGWVAVGVTTAGVVAVDRDGEVVSHDLATGRPDSVGQLGPLPLARLHVAGPHAAVLFRRGGVVSAAFLDTGAAEPALRVHRVSSTWSLWSALVEDTLLTLDGERVTAWTAAGRQREIRLPTSSIATTAIALARHPPGTDEAQAIQTRLLVACDGALHAWRMHDGRMLWRRELPTLTAPKSAMATSPMRLQVHDDRYLCVVDNRRVIVGDAVTGRPLRSIDVPSSDAIFAMDVSARTVRVVTTTREDCVRLLTARYDNVDDAVRVLCLGRATRTVSVLWASERVVVVTSDGLRAYDVCAAAAADPHSAHGSPPATAHQPVRRDGHSAASSRQRRAAAGRHFPGVCDG